MHAKVTIEEYGDSSVLKYQQDEILPEPVKGEVRIRIHAIGLNFIETYFRSGVYKVPSFPHVLGGEAAGVVDKVGLGVTQFSVGDRVCTYRAKGSYSEYTLVDAQMLVPLPDSIGFNVAAAVLLKGLTVQYLLKQVHVLKKDETVLFHAGAGGVGTIFLQWAKSIGAKVIATASSKKKCQLCSKLGAWATINYSEENFVDRVLELTGGAKVPVVYDSIGKDTWEKSLDCIQPRGLMVSYGNASGVVKDVSVGILNQKGSLFLTRPKLDDYAYDEAQLKKMSADLFEAIDSKKVKVFVNHEYSLKDIRQAHDDLSERRTTGCAVVYPEEFYVRDGVESVFP